MGVAIKLLHPLYNKGWIKIARYISERDYNAQMKKIKSDNKNKERLRALKVEKRKLRPKFKLPSTSKLVLFCSILICFEIVVFCEYTIIKLQDTSALYALIGIPATLIPIIWGYYSKSKAENTAGGIVYETAMREKQEITAEDLYDSNAVD